jgi:ABC-2 type transport system ATP-binding protein
MSETQCITVNRLEHSYGSRVALCGVDLEIQRGSIFGFVGPNGGGKTTLFNILSSLIPIQSGTVESLGFRLDRECSEYRRQIGVTFQAPGLDRRLTVRENLLHQGHLYGLSGRALQSESALLLERFGVADRSADIVDTLSGGLKRRVELAKCLIHRPQLLLLDEPSTGLDPGARRELWQYLEELRSRDSVTVVVTTHLMEEAERCDELILLDQGSIVAQGTPSGLREEIGGESVTIGCDQPDELRVRISGELGLEFSRSGEVLRLRSSEGHEILRAVAGRFSGEIRAISVDKPTLEDVFLEKTGRRMSDETAAD